MFIDTHPFEEEPRKSVRIHGSESLSDVLVNLNYSELDHLEVDVTLEDRSLFKFIQEFSKKVAKNKFDGALYYTANRQICNDLYQEFGYDAPWGDVDDIIPKFEDLSIPFTIELFNYFVLLGDWRYVEELQLNTHSEHGVVDYETEIFYLDNKTNSKLNLDFFEELLAKNIIKELDAKVLFLINHLKALGPEKIFEIAYEDPEDKPNEDWIYNFENM